MKIFIRGVRFPPEEEPPETGSEAVFANAGAHAPARDNRMKKEDEP